MASIAEIKAAALEIINLHPNGIRFTDLKREVIRKLPSANPQSVGAVISQLEDGKDCVRPARGVYAPLTYSHSPSPSPSPSSSVLISEEDIYKPFAEYLVEDLEECIWAVPIGSKMSNSKWSTPDVVGVWRTRSSYFSSHFSSCCVLELVSAEIKATTDRNELITGFGQACAYKLFSHKVYLVIPGDQSNEEDKSRIEDLCVLHGIGLILFYQENGSYRFEIRNRASKSEPDPYHLELFISKLGKEVKKELGLIC